MESGKIIVKGLCYEDVVSILTTNGYDVQVTAKATHNSLENEYVVKYKPHEFFKECEVVV